ncbi:hypothetical protein WN944_021306 [Citrus x changshan-huyou]|uniref:Uncharacterized protein n=1 Tax=Citrus x changshan-huyou TaxID=2935761 RepID=A0AAP0MZ06_9ROSI
MVLAGVDQWTVTKPSRSDEVLDAVEQVRIANQVRAQIDSMAPKRPTKPNRSEPDSIAPTNDQSAANGNIPELDKLRSLQSQSHVGVIYSAEVNNTAQDEFVETQYYKQLVSIDKDHHTTGTGFIRVANEGNGYNIRVGNGCDSGDRPVYKSNPATNDWIPSVEYDQAFISSKPNRSEGC